VEFYRQGDVGLLRISKLPQQAVAVESPDRIVLAYGEATGHAHAIDVSAGQARLWRSEKNSYVEVRSAADLRHEEHAPIRIEPGMYRVVLQREYDPVTAVRPVRD